MTRATIAQAIYSSQSFWAVVPWQQLDAKLRGEFLTMADAALAVIAQTRAATDEREAVARARIAAASVHPYSHNSALILDGERDGTDIVQSALAAAKAHAAEILAAEANERARIVAHLRYLSGAVNTELMRERYGSEATVHTAEHFDAAADAIERIEHGAGK